MKPTTDASRMKNKNKNRSRIASGGLDRSEPVHSVSDADSGLYILRMCGVFFYFFPEGRHEDSEGSEIAVKSIAPDGVGEVGVSECLADIFTEQA